MEFGPYIYQEYGTYTNLNWTTRKNNLTEIDEDVVLATFNQELIFEQAANAALF